MQFKAHNFQVDSIDFLKKNPCAGVFADPGLGKTAIVLSLIDQLFLFENTKTLIIAPLRVIHSVWPAEIAKWNQFKYLEYTILHGKDKEKNLQKDVDIYLINAENIFWLFELPELAKFNILVIDESSKFKNNRSKRLKILKKNLAYFQRRIILTGTPAPKSLMDLYAQMYILDRGESLGKYITHYRERYFYPTQFRNFQEWNLKPGSDKAIEKKIAPKVLRIEASDYLDLPDLIYNNIKVKLPKAALKIYDDLEKYLFAELDNEKLVVPTKSAVYNACHQIANGALYRPQQILESFVPASKRKLVVLHSQKLDALKELLGELQGKSVLVAYHFKHDLKALLQEFGEDTPFIGGGVSSKEGQRIINEWNSGIIPMLLGHPQSMSHGLNIQHGGSDIVWFSLTDDLENYIQFNRRIYRQGQTKQVRVHHILAEDTVDLAIMKRLKTKDKNQNALLKALKEYRRTK